MGELFISLRASTASFSKDLKRSTKLTKQSAQAMSKAFKIAAVAIAAAGAALAVLTKKSIDTADRMAKMSREIGISTEALSVLKREAELGGTNLETLSTGLQRLARNLSDAQNGLVTAQRAFGDLGIEVLDSNGKLRNLEEVTLEVADKFSKMEDGTRKTARAMELMGRGGVQLINTLNTLGEKGFAQARKEAELLGEVIDTQTAVAAEKFNDNLRDLQAVGKGLGITLASELLPHLNRLTDSAVDFATQGEGAKRLAEQLAAAFKSIAAAGLAAAFSFNKLQQVIETVTGNERTKAAQLVARAQQQLLNVEQEIFLQERALNFKRKEDFDQAVENLKGLRRKLQQVQSDLEGKKLFANLVGPPSFDPLFASVESLDQLGEQIGKLFSDLAVDVGASTGRIKTSLDDLNKSFKGTAVEADFLAPAIGKITDANKFFSEELRKSLELQKEQQEAFKNAPKLFADANEELRHMAENLDLANAGVQGLGGAFAAVTPKLELMKDFGQEFTSSLTSGFENLIVRGGKLSDVFQQLAADLARMFARAALFSAISGIFSSLFPGLGKAASSGAGGGGGFGGFFQHGGTLRAGQVGVVGEGGEPELIAAGVTSSITPLSKVGGVTQTINIDARGAGPGVMAEIRRGVRLAAKEMKALTKAEIAEASLRSA